ncbi:MAG: c-type cytochrome [Verrucomicrobiae bacterium]|nr:c-type cytochrome [Verrucomicrobiae bacterium]
MDYVHQPLPSPIRSIRWICVSAALAVSTFLCADEPPENDVSDKREEIHLYMKGRYVYQRHCVECHGTTGRGNGPWAAELEVKPRNFRSGLFKFRTTAYGTLPVETDLRRTIRSGISGTAMPIFSQLHDEEVDALIVYLKNLSRAWKDPTLAASPISQPDPPEWLASPEERSPHAESGKARFSLLCSSCHGTSGKGDGEAGKGLIDAWGFPIAPAMLAAPHHKSGDSPRDLYRTISTGLNGTPMIGYAATLKEEEIWELVAWILEWQTAATTP